MKVLIVSQYFWPENFRINDLAEEFFQRGHTVTVMTGMPNYPSGKLFPGYSIFGPWSNSLNGIKIYRVPVLTRGSGGHFRLFLNYVSFVVFASFGLFLRCRRSFDVVFVYEPSPITVAIPAIFLKFLTRSPIILWVLDLWPESLSATGAIRSKNSLLLIKKMVQFIYRNCDKILIQSQAFHSSVQDLSVPSEKILYFPSWAESVFEAGTSKIGLPETLMLPRGFCVLFAGNIGVAQDFPSILDAAERLKDYSDIHWVIVGNGRQFLWVQNEIKRRNLSGCVHLLGQYPLDLMPALYSSADALLVTLRRDPIFALTIPGKVQSYLAAGKPIIAALDGEGARIIHEAGAGKVCRSEDPVGLSSAVLEIFETSRGDLEGMGQNGANYAAKYFERNALMDKLEDWFREVALQTEKSKSPSNLT